MKKTPMVSVIIPAYNCELYIEDTIKSVIQQGIDGLEIIVVNDGSTDGTREIVQKYNSQVVLIDQENSGVCSARNRGLLASRGKYIAFMDHDDYWFPNKIASQLDAFDRNSDIGVVFTNFYWWKPEKDGGHVIPQEAIFLSKQSGTDQSFCGWIYHRMLFDSWVLTSTALAKREVFDCCGNFDEKLPYSEDWDLWLRVSRDFKFLKLNQFTTLYRQHNTQGSRVVRYIDYRTNLIKGALKKWGYCSKDGQCADKKSLQRKLAEYHTEFALNHIRDGSICLALKSLGKSVITDPSYWRAGAYAVAALVGWKPSW